MMETVRPEARQFLRKRCVSGCVGVGSMSWLGRDTVLVQYVRIKNWHSTYGGLPPFGLLWCTVISGPHGNTRLATCRSFEVNFFFSFSLSLPVGLSDFTDPWGLG